jgi:hypothetical protein
MNTTVGYTSFELQFQQVSQIDLKQSSPVPTKRPTPASYLPVRKEKKRGLKKFVTKIFRKTEKVEFEFVPNMNIQEQVNKIRQDRAVIEKKLKEVEKRIQNRRKSWNQNIENRVDLEGTMPKALKTALSQKKIIQRRLARKRAMNSTISFKL